ncbi:MAG: hypothetical protein FJ088_02050 [Deltaproteobacteria bacterium]|nr:hypothetical protein [Deltaproteobacteria bacterium]
MIQRLFILTLAGLSCFACAGKRLTFTPAPFARTEFHKVDGKKKDKPLWLWHALESRDCATAIGISGYDIKADQGLKRACEDGIRAVARGVWVKVAGKTGSVMIGETELSVEDISFLTSDGIMGALDDKVEVLDVYTDAGLDNYCLVAFPEKKGGCKTIDLKPMPSQKGKMPSWIDSPPVHKDFIYAVGTSRLFPDVKSMVRDAEDSAILNLAMSSGLAVSSDCVIDRSGIFQNIVCLREKKFIVELSGVRIAAWWTDETNGVRYALAKVRKDGIRKSYK